MVMSDVIDQLPDPLSVRQVAELYAVDGSTVRRWCMAGKFPRARKMNGWTWMISKRDLLEFRAKEDSNGLGR